MTMKSMKYQECDTIMDNYNPVPPPLPRRVPPVRNIYAEPFETNTSRWVARSLIILRQQLEESHCQPIIIILNSIETQSRRLRQLSAEQKSSNKIGWRINTNYLAVLSFLLIQNSGDRFHLHPRNFSRRLANVDTITVLFIGLTM